MRGTLTALAVTVKPEGALSRVALEWTDEAGGRQSTLVAGLSGDRIAAELERMTGRSEDARAGYLLGLARGISLERR